MSQLISPPVTAPRDPSTTPNPRRYYSPVERAAATLVQTAEESGGACTVIDVEVAPGGGTGLHYHKTYAERFTVVSGELGVQIGKQHRTLKPGETAIVPLMALHRWYNAGQEPALVRVALHPGSAGFERCMQIAYGLARDGQMTKGGAPKHITHLAVLLDLGDMGIPGVVGLIAPIMRLIATRARRTGIERALIARYCS
jgi:quercetin dioxygenase-like cupin family protein